jgi:hypothetical protein
MSKNYMVDAKMTGGFAFLAYPAEYSVSGIMTFIVDQRDCLSKGPRREHRCSSYGA